MKFPSFIQYNTKDCGPSCLKIISKYYGQEYSLAYLSELCQVSRDGTSISSMRDAAEKLGYDVSVTKMSWKTLNNDNIKLPCIIHLRQNHFVVLYSIGVDKKKLFISDPAIGLLTYDEGTFCNLWLDDSNCGLVVSLKPTPRFWSITLKTNSNAKQTQIKEIVNLIKPYKIQFIGIFITVFTVLGLNTLMPYLAQSVVDKGIESKDISLIVLILLAQVMIVVGQTSANIIRNIITLKASTNITINIISSFLHKLLKLPISFFETTLIGDIIQRVRDCDRLQVFFTTTLVSIVVSSLSVAIYAVVLGKYNLCVFIVFLLGSIIYCLWILFFLRYRKKLDYLKFQESSVSQSNIVEIFEAIHEIKLHQLEDKKISEWKQTQKKLYNASIVHVIISFEK